uniref:Leucine-rich repeat-containing protein 58 n=1 Tax=Meloidogyne incognita TaxID=6306 RepID=A0A914L8K6_MELIC
MILNKILENTGNFAILENKLTSSFCLKILYVGGNRLIAVPGSIGALSELTSLGLADNRLESIPSSIANLHKLTTLSLHNNKIKVLPPGIARLKNLEQLSLRNNPLVTDFVNEILLEPPTLKELAARIVKIRFSINIYRNLIPLELVNYLNTANQCVNPKCKGVYFESCSELVKFVDFCGKYRVPLLHYLCSSKCSTIEPAYAYTSSSSAESDDDQWAMSSTYAKEKMKKVLLG